MYRTGRYKLVVYHRDELGELFDLENDPHEFDNLWDHSRRPESPEAYYDRAEKDMVRISRDFVGAHTGIGALILECTGMQPFARAIQRMIDIPIFSWGTMLDYAYSVAVHRDYYGHV